MDKLPKNWMRHHEFWKDEKSYKELDDMLVARADSLPKGGINSPEHKDWEEAQDDIRYARSRWERVRKNMTEVKEEFTGNEQFTVDECDVEYTGGGITVAYGTFTEKPYCFSIGSDMLFVYDADERELFYDDDADWAEWEDEHNVLGDNFGFTDDSPVFQSVLKQVYDKCTDPSKDDLDIFYGNKEILGIKESVNPMVKETKRLRESTEEIDRKLFGSLVKYSDPIFANASHGVLNDGTLVYKFWARNDEDAKKVFQKFGVRGRPETDRQGYAIVESKQLNEGPGAGYTISGKIGDVKINDINISVDGETDTTIYYGIECDITADLIDVETRSYYYGGRIPETPIKIEWIGLSAEKSWELPTPNEETVYGLLMSLDFETIYGGGWSHSKFENDLELDYHECNYSCEYDLDKLKFEFTDPNAVDAIDRYATGSNFDREYSVVDEDEYEVDPGYDTLEDAIDAAREQNLPFVKEEKWFWEYLGNDEYNTIDDGWEAEIVWENDELEVED